MFITSLQLRYDPPAGLWVLSQDLVYERPCGEYVVAPEGMATDLDSVPRLPLIYWRLKDRARKSAAIHDSLYLHGRTMGRNSRPVTRAEADAIMLEAMRTEGLPRRWRWPIWLGVRAGGWASWDAYRRG